MGRVEPLLIIYGSKLRAELAHLAHAVDDLIEHVRGVSGNTGCLLQFGEPAPGIVHAHLPHHHIRLEGR